MSSMMASLHHLLEVVSRSLLRKMVAKQGGSLSQTIIHQFSSLTPRCRSYTPEIHQFVAKLFKRKAKKMKLLVSKRPFCSSSFATQSAIREKRGVFLVS